MKINHKNKLILKKGVIVKKMGIKLVIYNPDRSSLYTLNETASYIFAKLKQGYALPQTSTDLANRYHIPLQQARRDVESFLTSMKANGIVG